ncbi:hypothetical protein CALCODRAFT_15498 [Calocera cornea HHB12733]|uniref:Novel STAND NTPase 1 domain-containing protein n=1 Tax=Calocera cornea HHB12733 TaxID=1353952 RepID=A0A165E8J9_9BASI|nr:hypothetical protein CALCODRAFT_15498 [Calocera cornea HHB12733]
MAPATNNSPKASAEGDSRSRLKALKPTLNPTLNRLVDVAISVLDIRDELTVNKAECDALALRVAEITESILLRTTSSPEMARMYSSQIRRLQDCVDDISRFLVEQTKRGFVTGLTRLTDNDRIRSDLAAKDKRLNDVIATLNLDFNMTAVAMGSLAGTSMMGALGSTGISPLSQRVQTTLSITRLPPKPRIFHGRDDIVKQIVSSLLQARPAHVALLGMGGIGKTSTAATVLHNEEVKAKFGTNRVFLSCDSITTANGIASALSAALEISSAQQGDPVALLIQHIENLDDFIFLVLDNLESTWDTPDRNAVEQLLVELSNLNTLSLVITMRGQQRPLGVDWSILPPLGTLDLDTSRTIYSSNGGKMDEHVDELLRELDGWPLAVVLMAYQGQNRPPNQLLEAYKKERTALLARGRAGHLTSVDVSISLSLNGQSVQEAPGALELLRLLCLLPDGIETSALPEAFPLMPGLQHAERVLEQVSLLTRPVENEIKVLSPIRAFVLSMNPPYGPHLITLEDFLIETVMKSDRLFGFAETSEEASAQVTKLVMKHFGNMMSVFSNGLQMSTVREDILSGILLLSVFSILMHYGDTFDLLRKGIHVGKQTPALHDLTGQLCLIQALHSCLPGQNVNPLTVLEEAKEITQDPVFEARGMLVVASRQLQQVVLGPGNGSLVTAESVDKLLKDARGILEVQGDANFVAWCTEVQGLLALGTGNFKDAIALGEATRAAFEELQNGFGIARGLYIIGSSSILNKQWEEGEEVLRAVLLAY